jgi:hypothetical protein
VATQMVKMSAEASFLLHDLVVPLIAFSTANQLETSYLCKDGVELWLRTMRNLPMDNYPSVFNDLLNSRLDGLLKNDLLSLDFEDVKIIMLIIECYGIFGSTQCLISCAEQLQQVFLRTVGG